ncbi:MAG: Protein archease [Candidatus Woesearchaeota archaeon]|nr:Protein archease [Candidatus Woesearchaeota archaeon]
MGYKYLEHEADVGIQAFGNTVKKAFEDGAKAMFNVMIDLDQVEHKKEVEINCKADNLPALFIEWLNELLAQMDISIMFFSDFKVKIIEDKGFSLIGQAIGEKINLDKHETKTEVKAATYSGLDYKYEGKQHYFECLLDV